MDPSHHPLSPSNPPLPVPRQSKTILQRQYRANEGECFNTLRELINELTGEEPQTRHEILRKVIDLLLTAEVTRELGAAQVDRPIPYETPAALTDPTDETSAYMGYSAESSSSSLPENSQSTVELGTQPGYYVTQSYGHDYLPVFDMSSDLNQGSSQGYGQDWSS